MTTEVNDDYDEFASLVQLLASTKFDGFPRSKRLFLQQEAQLSVENLSSARSYLATQCQDLSCKTRPGYQRLVPLFLLAVTIANQHQDDTEAVVPGLIGSTCQMLQQGFQAFPKTLHNEWPLVWKPTFLKLARKKDDNSNNNSDKLAQAIYDYAQNDSGIWSVAIALGFDLSTTSLQLDWSTLFQDKAFGSNQLPKQHEVQASALFWQHVFDKQSGWPQEWLDTLLRKFKANPEGGLETLLGFVSVSTARSSSQNVYLPWATEKEYVTVLIKQAQSTKDASRHMARDILATASHHPPSLADSVLPALSKLQASTTTAPQRLTLFQLYQQLALPLLSQSSSTTNESLDPQLTSTIKIISDLFNKEAKTAIESREAGMTALWYWYAIAKQISNNEISNKAIQPVVACLKAALSKSDQVVAIVGHFLLTVHDPNLIQQMTLDLFGSAKFDATLEKACDKLTTAATTAASNKKQSQAPVDALIVLYLGLAHATATATAKVPSYVTKAWKASPNFVWSATMLEVLTVNNSNVMTRSLVQLLLPRILALAAAPTTDLPLKQAPAARALAACTCNPYPGAGKVGVSNSNNKTPFAVINPSQDTCRYIQTVLQHQPKLAPALAKALWNHVNSYRPEEQSHCLPALRQTSHDRDPPQSATATIEGESKAASVNSHTVRTVACDALASSVDGETSPDALAQVLILMHVGSCLKPTGCQRNNVRRRTMQVLKQVAQQYNNNDNKHVSELAERLAVCAASASLQWNNSDNNDKDDSSTATISNTIHKATASVMMSLGSIGGKYLAEQEMGMMDEDGDDEEAPKEANELEASKLASVLCAKEIPQQLNSLLTTSRDQVESLSPDEIALLLTPLGSLHKTDGDATNEDSSSSVAAKASKGKKSRGGFNAKEDEEWEAQLKKELAEKKKKEAKASGAPTKKVTALSPEEKKKVEQQDQERERLSALVFGDFLRALQAIRYLTMSDIDVGSACLPVFAESVLSTTVSNCAAMRDIRDLRIESFDTLVVLAGSVYEIMEEHALMLASALTMSCKVRSTMKSDERKTPRKDSSKDDDSMLVVSALPSHCEPAAIAIREMEENHGALSGNSFVFLFPIIRAALYGPRTPHGCEAALSILSWHTTLLAGDEVDPVVVALRKDMVVSVLELLKHDRAQTFLNPNPSETLVSCFLADEDSGGGPSLSTSELAPLLDDRGALGSKACRAAAMIALRNIALQHEGLLKKNPLIENRLWLNCFEQDEHIQIEARKAWRAIQGDKDDTSDEDLSKISKPPSLMYAAPLLPLLSNPDKSIASSAASAYATGMAMHPKSVSKNIQKLCNSYIDAFPPKSGGASKSAALPMPVASKKTPAVAPKKPVSVGLGLPKKKTTKKSALSVAGIGNPTIKKKKKSSAVTAALLKPKQERTLDSVDLASQFQTTKSQEKQVSEDSEEKQSVRLGILQAVAEMAKAESLEMDVSTLILLTGFLMAYGIAESNENVKSSARNALRDIVATYGGSDDAIAFLLPHLEEVLTRGLVSDDAALSALSKEKIPDDVDSCDRRKEGAVVALGSVALHLKGDENAKKVDDTVDMLIAALNTPSEDVQSSISECLQKLMKKGNTKERVESLVAKLLQDCLQGENLASRRGAAYGLAAVVKGSGIATLKKYEVVKQLEEACDSGTSNSKEGALFSIELLSTQLGLLFEPYIIVLLPSLLRAFSDSSDYVRRAASDTCGLIMSKLSAHGVKLVMPAVLTAFNDPAWRTKQASIRMLGAMSHLAPKQLASALPKVVPKLTEAFGDTHPKVKSAAQEALDEISTVVRNPEIASISQLLLKALTDPADYTTKALEGLIATEFLHAIDAPSLAMIVPILHRGLRDRGATTKRYGALIAGNICTMINDARDFVPYVSTLLPDLKGALLDPIPDVRSTAAKALGSLTRGLGDNILGDLRPWLIEKLGDDSCSSAERSGAANGLTEVLIAAGTDVVEDAMMQEILPLKDHPDAAKREGVLWMLTFLPTTLGQGFTPLVDAALPALIGGLSDDSEAVREVAMRAGRVLIRSHGKVHVDKILPSLESGLVDDDYRIRLASLTLLGDLLSTIGGTSLLVGDGDTREDIRRAERAQAQIALALGNEKRKRVLSGLYLARSDNTSVVRHHAIQVWKTVVSVTARTLKDILPVLVGQVVVGLASGDADRTLVAGRCLGEIVTKLGDSVVPEVIPVLRTALYEGDSNKKLGVCVGLTEVIKCSSKDQILRFIEIIVKLVQDALCDEDEQVCAMAASSFQSLYSVVGSRALDEVVPSLMVALETSYDEKSRTRALNGLTGIMKVKSRDLLPYVVPRLLQRPVTKSHAVALAGIARVTGDVIHYHFHAIISVLLEEVSMFNASQDGEEGEKEEAIRECCQAVCASVEEAGVNSLLSEIASKCSHDKPEMRMASCWMFEVAITERAGTEEICQSVPIILRELIYRLNDSDPGVLKAGHKAWSALSSKIEAEKLAKHIEFMRNLINSMVSEARRRKGGVGDGEFLMPGFNMPKGLEPLLPIYQRGILYGTPVIREVSAAGLGEVISMTSNKYLAGPVIIKMTGPLLRVVGDRNPSNVKIAILRTLGLILTKGGPALRAFVPQFQTTFVKALSDPSRQVRVEAIKALTLLMPLSTRVDPLIKELVTGSLGKTPVAVEGEASGAVAAVQTATLEALAAVLTEGGKKAKLPDTIRSAFDASTELLKNEDESVREGAGKVLGASVSLMEPSFATQFLEGEVFTQGDSVVFKHGSACAVRHVFSSSVGEGLDQSLKEKALQIMMAYINDDNGSVREAACVAFGPIVGKYDDPKGGLSKVEPILFEIMSNTREPLEIHRALAAGFCIFLQLTKERGMENVDLLGKSLMDSILKLAMSGSQRVQFAFNDVLYVALDVASGQDGLDKYLAIAQFDNVKAMKSLYTKVLVRIKEITILDDY